MRLGHVSANPTLKNKPTKQESLELLVVSMFLFVHGWCIGLWKNKKNQKNKLKAKIKQNFFFEKKTEGPGKNKTKKKVKAKKKKI